MVLYMFFHDPKSIWSFSYYYLQPGMPLQCICYLNMRWVVAKEHNRYFLCKVRQKSFDFSSGPAQWYHFGLANRFYHIEYRSCFNLLIPSNCLGQNKMQGFYLACLIKDRNKSALTRHIHHNTTMRPTTTAGWFLSGMVELSSSMAEGHKTGLIVEGRNWNLFNNNYFMTSWLINILHCVFAYLYRSFFYLSLSL